MRKLEYLEKTPDDELQKMSHTKAPKFKIETRTLALVTGKESRHAIHHTMHLPYQRLKKKLML